MPSQDAPPSHIVRPAFGGHALSKFLWKRLHLPRGVVHAGLSGTKRALAREQVKVRAGIARDQAVESQAFGTIPESDGYLRFGPREMPGIDPVLERCREIYDERRDGAAPEGFQFNRNKQFLLALASGNEFVGEDVLLRFMVSRPIVDAVTAYLGTVPLLAGAALWWSPPNQTATASQRFHVDTEDWRQIKILVNVFDTDETCGPFTLLPAATSDRLREQLKHQRGRLDDDCVLDGGREAETIALTGESGSGAFVDTARCLHFGSRGNQVDRLVLMIQFMRFDSPTESTFDLRPPPQTLGGQLDEVQRLVLGVE